jgi:ribonuclease HIII
MNEKTGSKIWVGIDEAGYGPNIGPLVMTAVVAQGSENQPDLWNDIEGVFRAHDTSGRLLCIDDSKLVLARRDGMDLLERAFRSMAMTIMDGVPNPFDRERWVSAIGPDVFGGAEIPYWVDDLNDYNLYNRNGLSLKLVCQEWRILTAQVKVVGPQRFNQLLDERGNKASAHSVIFIEILKWLQTVVEPGEEICLISDKHGGRHFYSPVLLEAFPGSWIQRVQEGPTLSHYKVTHNENLYDLKFQPRADSQSSLVALASMVSKFLREKWMDQFNAWFARRLPDLKPTAGYPVDAKRFAAQIAEYCLEHNISTDIWWRRK